MTERSASGPAADPERGRQRHRRCCLHQHAWADRRSDCNNHRADRLKRSDGILHLSVSAIAAGRIRNAWGRHSGDPWVPASSRHAQYFDTETRALSVHWDHRRCEDQR